MLCVFGEYHEEKECVARPRSQTDYCCASPCESVSELVARINPNCRWCNRRESSIPRKQRVRVQILLEPRV